MGIPPAPSKINPYRQLVRRRFSEPLLLALIFVFGVWLWDNHLSRAESFPPDAFELALRKADRDLRLSEGTSHVPDWLRPILGLEPLKESVGLSVQSFQQLLQDRHRHAEEPAIQQLNDQGAYALSVLLAIQAEANPAEAPFQQLGLTQAPNVEDILARVINGKAYWWDIEYLRGIEYPVTDLVVERSTQRTRRLVNRAITTRATVAALALGGLAFLPGTLLAFMRAGRKQRPLNYSHHWQMSFGVGVFLVAFLASLGFGLSFNLVVEQIAAQPVEDADQPLIPMPLFTLLDSTTRFLPALIAISLLFRRPRHAISRLGLAGPLDGRMVLGSFSILWIIEFGLRMVIDRSGPPDPLGGLSSIESGVSGLVYGVATACIAAPITEEILYRGVLFRSLANRLKLPLAVIVSSLVFAVVHFYPLSSLVLIAFVGATCALCYISSRTLLTAICLHGLYNAAIKIPEWIVYHASLS